MKRAFPPREIPSGIPQLTAVGMITMCRSQKDLNHIVNVVRYWEPGMKISDPEPGYARKRLQEFCMEHPNEAKIVKQYSLGIIYPPGGQVCTAMRRLEKNKMGRMKPGQIAVSMEEIFDAINEWHLWNNHMG
jgi:hypothetical protein